MARVPVGQAGTAGAGVATDALAEGVGKVDGALGAALGVSPADGTIAADDGASGFPHAVASACANRAAAKRRIQIVLSQLRRAVA